MKTLAVVLMILGLCLDANAANCGRQRVVVQRQVCVQQQQKVVQVQQVVKQQVVKQVVQKQVEIVQPIAAVEYLPVPVLQYSAGYSAQYGQGYQSDEAARLRKENEELKARERADLQRQIQELRDQLRSITAPAPQPEPLPVPARQKPDKPDKKLPAPEPE
jgi:hypothetical protein